MADADGLGVRPSRGLWWLSGRPEGTCPAPAGRTHVPGSSADGVRRAVPALVVPGRSVDGVSGPSEARSGVGPVPSAVEASPPASVVRHGGTPLLLTQGSRGLAGGRLQRLGPVRHARASQEAYGGVSQVRGTLQVAPTALSSLPQQRRPGRPVPLQRGGPQRCLGRTVHLWTSHNVEARRRSPGGQLQRAPASPPACRRGPQPPYLHASTEPRPRPSRDRVA